MRNRLIMLCLTVGTILNITGVVRACGLDGVPSLQINGQLVLLNRVPPVKGQLATWAPFVAPDVYPTGRPVLLQEIRGRVLWSLPPSAFKIPWRWAFGDGTQAQGMRVRHIYQHPGKYVVGVRAYLIDGKDAQWYLFDTAIVHVR